MCEDAPAWPENAPGAFYVDETCIDCDLCRTTAPDCFTRSENGYSFVIDASAAAELRPAPLLYASADTDITEAFLAEINKGPFNRVYVLSCFDDECIEL